SIASRSRATHHANPLACRSKTFSGLWPHWSPEPGAWGLEPGAWSLERGAARRSKSAPRSVRHRRRSDQMLLQIPRDHAVDVQRRARAFVDRVGAAGVDEVVERFPQFDQTVHEAFRALDVDVVVSRAVDEEQSTLQAAGERDWGAGAV